MEAIMTQLKTIGVVINDIYDANIKEGTNCSLREMSRGCWPVGNSSRARACEYLVASAHGNLVGAWRIDKTKGMGGWMLPNQSPRKGLPPKLEAERKKMCDPFRAKRRVCELIDLSAAEQAAVIKAFKARFCGQIGYC